MGDRLLTEVYWAARVAEYRAAHPYAEAHGWDRLQMKRLAKSLRARYARLLARRALVAA